MLGRREGILSSGTAYVVQFMVLNAIGPALLAMLAVVLYLLGVPESLLLRACSAVYLATASYFVALSLRRERTLATSGELVLPRGLGRAIWGLALIAHLVQISNLIGFPAGPSVGVFLLGLWILLLMAAIQFVALLFLALS